MRAVAACQPSLPPHLHPPLLQDRGDLVDQLEKRPDAMWRTGTIWSFKNDAKVGAGSTSFSLAFVCI